MSDSNSRSIQSINYPRQLQHVDLTDVKAVATAMGVNPKGKGKLNPNKKLFVVSRTYTNGESDQHGTYVTAQDLPAVAAEIASCKGTEPDKAQQQAFDALADRAILSLAEDTKELVNTRIKSAKGSQFSIPNSKKDELRAIINDAATKLIRGITGMPMLSFSSGPQEMAQLPMVYLSEEAQRTLQSIAEKRYDARKLGVEAMQIRCADSVLGLIEKDSADSAVSDDLWNKGCRATNPGGAGGGKRIIRSGNEMS